MGEVLVKWTVKGGGKVYRQGGRKVDHLVEGW